MIAKIIRLNFVFGMALLLVVGATPVAADSHEPPEKEKKDGEEQAAEPAEGETEGEDEPAESSESEAPSAEDDAADQGDDLDQAAEGDGADDGKKAEGPSLPSISVPNLNLPVGSVPGVDGLKRQSVEREEVPERRRLKQAEYTVRKVVHAHGHRASARGCAPTGRLEGFKVERFPSRIQEFSSCVRLSADRAVIARLAARILNPRGREVADASGEVSFDGRGTAVDYVIEWVGFPAERPGTYEIVLELDHKEVARFPLEVSAE